MTGSEFILVVLWVACSFVGIILLSRKGYLNEPTNVDIIKIQGIGTEVEMGGRIRPAEYSHARQDDGISIGYAVGLVAAFFAGPLAPALGVLLPRRRKPAT